MRSSLDFLNRFHSNLGRGGGVSYICQEYISSLKIAVVYFFYESVSQYSGVDW